MKKKILSFVLVLSMLCAFMPVIAVAETSGTCGDNVTWTLDQNGTLTISGAGDMENSAFYNNNNIKSVIIEKGAFAGCANLTTVEYSGNQSDWNEIYIGTDNENLTNATINYNNALTPKPTPIPITKATITKTETDITYDFDVATENTYEDCYVYVAVYDENGILCAINRVPLETTGNTSVSVDKNDNAKKAKVFVFSSTLQPIITSEEFPLI